MDIAEIIIILGAVTLVGGGAALYMLMRGLNTTNSQGNVLPSERNTYEDPRTPLISNEVTQDPTSLNGGRKKRKTLRRKHEKSKKTTGKHVKNKSKKNN